MAELEEYIAASRQIRNERQSERDRLMVEERERIKDLRVQVLGDACGRVGLLIPAALREFVVFAGEGPDEATLMRYPEEWQPTEFAVMAPRALVTISFTVAELVTVVGISVAGESFSDFSEATARAADLYEPAHSSRAPGTRLETR